MKYLILVTFLLTGCSTISDLIQGDPLRVKDCLDLSKSAAERAYKECQGDSVNCVIVSSGVAEDVYKACMGQW